MTNGLRAVKLRACVRSKFKSHSACGRADRIRMSDPRPASCREWKVPSDDWYGMVTFPRQRASLPRCLDRLKTEYLSQVFSGNKSDLLKECREGSIEALKGL